jgi:alpha-amylase/alpha-mannosidase (GH57 family)
MTAAAPKQWLCIHGHFYQPPRENPWLEAIEPQPSAHPYRDWNARITAECYRPNSAARVIDHDQQIIAIVDNYQRMSFNVGPTLMAWLEVHAPDVHRAVVDADRASLDRFGRGSAMAQAYNHMIMPLASPRDRATQVRWGIADFVHRFGRRPEGMWLPECAADTPSLEALAAEGIAFTVLAPHQARAWRPPGGAWRTSPVDPGRPYRCALPSGRSIDLFFYDGATAQAVAFERLLVDGHQIVARMTARGPLEDGGAPLCHIATDGETYGHHHRYGDMALAWAFSQVERGWNGTRLTNYAALRVAAPATWEVQLAEETSWSCAHGVARWRDNCGCNGGKPGWSQRWRRPLRDALDWLRGQAAGALDGVGRVLLRDPWAARDAYIGVILARTAAARDQFLAEHASYPLGPADRVRALSLMEMARHAMLMYTSCGWFFDDLSGIETVQCMQYAARAAELLEELGGAPVEAALVERLALATSNLPDEGDGRRVWAQRVVPARVAPARVCAHVAVDALVDPGGGPSAALGGAAKAGSSVFGYDVEFGELVIRRSGRARVVAGTVSVRSQLTEAQTLRCFAALHLGEQHVTGGLCEVRDPAAWARFVDELQAAFETADVFAAQRVLERQFPATGADGAGRPGALASDEGGGPGDANGGAGRARGAGPAGAPGSAPAAPGSAPERLDLSALLPGTREGVIAGVLAEAIAAAERALGGAYDDRAPLVRWLVAHALPVPEVLHAIAKAALRRRVLGNLRAAEPSFAALREHLAEAARVRVNLDTPEIALAASEALHRVLEGVVSSSGELDGSALESASRAAEVAARMRSGVDLWASQNATYRLLARLPELRRAAGAGDATAARTAEDLQRLARALRLVVPRG